MMDKVGDSEEDRPREGSSTKPGRGLAPPPENHHQHPLQCPIV